MAAGAAVLGGLFTALAGLKIFGSTQMSLNGLTFKMGPTGFLTWLIPAILVTCGMLLWFSPQQRMFYSVVAAVTAVYSLIGVNLGGFFIGLLLGMIGSALGFAWGARPPAGGGRGRAGSGRGHVRRRRGGAGPRRRAAAPAARGGDHRHPHRHAARAA